MTEHLLLISIGPIQDFINSARRCQDLWFGSWLLSDLARTVAKSVKDQTAGEPLIFPAGIGEETATNDKPAVANKILAQISVGDPSEIAKKAKDAMHRRLKELAEAAYKDLESRKYFKRDLAFKQLGDLMEMQWVSVPFSANYAEARDRAEQLLAARKNSRNWGAVSWHDLAGVGVPKSSLDGLRESVIDEKVYNDFRRDPDGLYRRYHVKNGERLCGVGMLKRCGAELDEKTEAVKKGLKRPVFHSTSHVASLPILARIKSAGYGLKEFQNYLEVLETAGVDTHRFLISAGEENKSEIKNPLGEEQDGFSVPRVFATSGTDRSRGFDGYILFESRIPELLTDYNKNFKDSVDDENRKHCVQALRAFRKVIGLRENHTAYYAYLLADGDSMGKTIDALAKTTDGIGAHRGLGKALEGFSADCRSIVEKAGGSLVYAGGDDVLALCPLHTALQLSRELRNSFDEHVGKAIPEGIAKPTLSVGLGIAHHMTHMDQARALAKRAEKVAKDAGRNALAIVMEKRSGGTLEICRQWSDRPPLDEWLSQLCRWLHEKKLPHGFAFDLEQMMAPFEVVGAKKDDDKVDFSTVVGTLARGILSRKQAAEDVMKQLSSSISAAKDCRKLVAELSAEIQVARLFLGAYEDAFVVNQEKEVTE